ncbi:MAG: serine/threonine protein kinase [Hapalosiphonaceae cyanobacterium JJU2]|nr:MAG: serine/threonine protein kinase [Hapalosiphonaceae cyanobacterium JJU2]
MHNMSQYLLSLIGITLRNRYKIIKLLGSGGSGDTYLAVDLDLPGIPYCVVKHFKPKNLNPAHVPIAKNLFAKEAEVLYQLGDNHNQIPRLFAHFDENGDFYLVQEFIDGHDLTQEISPGICLNEDVVFNLLREILEVVVFVHQNNIIHRDIKPQNLMRRHSDGKIVLIDFGSIKKIGGLGINEFGQTSVTVVVGTPGYMSSEQSKGKPQLCSDIYAVGMVGIQALTGLKSDQIPKDPNTGEIVWRDRIRVSNSLANVIDKMVCDRSSKRYQSALEALEALIAARDLSFSSLPVIKDKITDNNSAIGYKKNLLLWGMGFGVSTSLLIIFILYIFLQTSIFNINKPPYSFRFLKQFFEPVPENLQSLKTAKSDH